MSLPSEESKNAKLVALVHTTLRSMCFAIRSPCSTARSLPKNLEGRSRPKSEPKVQLHEPDREKLLPNDDISAPKASASLRIMAPIRRLRSILIRVFDSVRGAPDEHVSRLYRHLLGREPRSAEVTNGRGRPTIDVALEIAQSSEFLTRVRSATCEDVSGLYRHLLTREPEPMEVTSWRSRPIVDVVLGIVQSPEFLMRVRSATREDVLILYRHLLTREPEPAEVNNWRGRPITDVVLEVTQSSEFLALIDESLITPEQLCSLYETFLPRRAYPLQWYEEFSRIVRLERATLLELIAYFHKMALHERGIPVKNAALVQSVCLKNPSLTNFGSKVTLVIPTVNSEPFLEHVIDFYLSFDVRVLFAVDRRTCDRTRSLISQKDVDFIEVDGDHPRVGSLLNDIVTQIDTEWILRLEDAELPSPAMLDFVDHAVTLSSPFAWGFPRARFRYSPKSGELEYSQFLSFNPVGERGRRWRLFRREDFRPDDHLHSAGLSPKEQQSAPPDAFIFDFNWVLHSLAARMEKMLSYETQNFTMARLSSHFSLYETIPESWHMFMPLRDEKYRRFAERIYRSPPRPDQTNDPP